MPTAIPYDEALRICSEKVPLADLRKADAFLRKHGDGKPDWRRLENQDREERQAEYDRQYRMREDERQQAEFAAARERDIARRLEMLKRGELGAPKPKAERREVIVDPDVLMSLAYQDAARPRSRYGQGSYYGGPIYGRGASMPGPSASAPYRPGCSPFSQGGGLEDVWGS